MFLSKTNLTTFHKECRTFGTIFKISLKNIPNPSKCISKTEKCVNNSHQISSK